MSSSPLEQTSFFHQRYRHDRISAISGIAVSPRRFRCILYRHLDEDNIQSGKVALFLRHLLLQTPGHLIVQFDNGKTH